MKKLIYKINKTITGRVASQLVWDLNTIDGEVRIINIEGRMINGKSLIGLLSACIKDKDIITIIINNDNEKNVKECLNKIGTYIGEE